jgi:hypothetical protein
MTNDRYAISFSVSGKAGETKSVSHTPSEDGILRVFSAYYIRAIDDSTVPGEGTIVLDVRSGEHWPIALGARQRISCRACSIHAG